MNTIPWIDNSVKFIIKTEPGKGLRIEQIKEPWDLYLEGHFLQSEIGSPDHIDWIKDGKEVIFSIRDLKREPLADIICMPIDAFRYDDYWKHLRVFKTSSPMTVSGEELVVLEVIGKGGKRAKNNLLDVAKKFFVTKGGDFNNEWPFGVDVKNEKELKKWQKRNRTYVDWNLCIDSKASHTLECQLQSYTLEDTINKLRGFFDNIYINADLLWTEKVMDHLEEHPADLPKGKFYVYGHNEDRRDQYLVRARKWYERITREQEQEWCGL